MSSDMFDCVVLKDITKQSGYYQEILTFFWSCLFFSCVREIMIYKRNLVVIYFYGIFSFTVSEIVFF